MEGAATEEAAGMEGAATEEAAGMEGAATEEAAGMEGAATGQPIAADGAIAALSSSSLSSPILSLPILSLPNLCGQLVAIWLSLGCHLVAIWLSAAARPSTSAPSSMSSRAECNGAEGSSHRRFCEDFSMRAAHLLEMTLPSVLQTPPPPVEVHSSPSGGAVTASP